MDTVTLEAIPIGVGQEEDGRWWADIESMREGFLRGMSRGRSVKAKQLLAALLRIGWTVAWQTGSHRRLTRRRPGRGRVHRQRRRAFLHPRRGAGGHLGGQLFELATHQLDIGLASHLSYSSDRREEATIREATSAPGTA